MRKSLIAVALLCGTSASEAFAQVASPAPADPQSGAPAGSPSGVQVDSASREILVTARRREETLQDVPIAITALSGEALEQRGIRNSFDLQFQTPSLSVTGSGFAANTLQYSIRGQRTLTSFLLSDPPVGLYFADVNVPRPYGFGSSFYDIQSVQVLKGVQGTLFGRNMTGGAVLIEPNHPDFSGVHGTFVGQLGNYNQRDVTGMLNAPLTDWLAVRVAGHIRKRDGYTTEVSTGRDYDDENSKGFRASAEMKFDRITNYTVFDYVRNRTHGPGIKLVAYSFTDTNGNPTFLGLQNNLSAFFPTLAGVAPQNLPALMSRAIALGRRQLDFGNPVTDPLSGFPGQNYSSYVKNYGITNKTTFDAGDVTFKNIFGYRKVIHRDFMDADGSPVMLIQPLIPTNTRSYSEEFQMQGNPFGDRFNFTLGAFYFNEAGRDGNVSLQLPQLSDIFAPTGLTSPNRVAVTDSYAKAISYAFYGAGEYRLTDTLKLSGGIRYNNDKRKVTVNPTIPAQGVCRFDPDGNPATPSGLTVATCSQSREITYDAVTWDATLTFEPTSNTTAYAAIRKGYRSGGYNLQAISNTELTPFRPETVQEYEVGLKQRFDLGGAELTVNGAAYYQNYSNVQRQAGVVDPDTGISSQLITNTDKKHNTGAEFEANLQTNSGFYASLFYSYIHNKNVIAPPGSDPQVAIPAHQVGGSIGYGREYDGLGKLGFNLNGSYRSKVHLWDGDPSLDQPGYFLANARIELNEIAGTGLGAALFVNNLTNKYYWNGGVAFLNLLGFTTATAGEPRMYGAEVSFRF